jgi:argininosuccinate lyase
MLYRKWGTEKDPVLWYTSSYQDDTEILEQVKLVMKAHVVELFLSGYISREACRILIQGINAFKEIGKNYEDIHEALEDHLLKFAGDFGGMVGFGRSRNDHVATALRLKMREELISLLEELLQLRGTLIRRAQDETTTLFPSFTHFQPAQPTSFGHYLLYVEEELAQRWEMIFSALRLVNRSPLGSGAVVGTSVALNREREANILGFEGVITNTISATSSRADLISASMEVGVLMLVLSRVAEDLILLSSKLTNIIQLPDEHVSTSSLMPQKRNAVTMEILRAKTSEVLGALMTLSSIYKSLPSGYNLDLQEMNPEYWAILSEARKAVYILHDLLSKLRVRDPKLDVETLSTDDAESRVKGDVSYRTAYFEVAKSLREGSFRPSLTFEDSLARKAVKGSPNPSKMRESIMEVKNRLETHERVLNEYKNLILKGIGELRSMEDDILQEGS